MLEQWRDIANYPGYQVSNLGSVRTKDKITSSAKYSRRKWKDRTLKTKTGKDHSVRVELWNKDGHKTFLVHRLVASAFLGEYLDSKLTVNHKDGNRLNNRVDNLEWVSLADNIRHGFNTGLYTHQKECKLIINDAVYVFRSISEASRFIGRNSSYISNALKLGRKVITKSGKCAEIILTQGQK